MIATTGQIFHIDFAHFLGNTMKFGGLNRESAPFVMTKEYLYVIGGPDSANYTKFIQHALFCYQILRENAYTLKTLFSLLQTAKIPELNSANDILYINKALKLNVGVSEAAAVFLTLIDESINSKGTQLNFFIHNLVHPD